MHVEKATTKDIPTLIQFQIAMAQETENLILDADTLNKGIDALFEDPSKGKYYVIRDKDEIAGCLMLTNEWSDWRNGTVLWIQSVFIPKKYRGRGIFRQMYDHVQQLVENDNALRGIRLYVDNSNINAQKVYAAIGMTDEHYTLYEWMK